MLLLFAILVILASLILGLIVLVQNPKGGGLSGSFGGAANQIFGYKRTTDDIEKITWGLVIVVFALCLSAAAIKPAAEETTTQGLGGKADRSAAVQGAPVQSTDGQESNETPIETETQETP